MLGNPYYSQWMDKKNSWKNLGEDPDIFCRRNIKNKKRKNEEEAWIKRW